MNTWSHSQWPTNAFMRAGARAHSVAFGAIQVITSLGNDAE